MTGDSKDTIARARQRYADRPKPPSADWIRAEMAHCAADKIYFVNTYCKIYDNDTHDWMSFKLWPAQERALRESIGCKRFISLKTRQIGFTWLFGIADSLHEMIFNPISEILMFSQSDNEAMKLIGDQRMRGMYERLPEWMRPAVAVDNEHELRFKNGSGAHALPATRGGDSYTVTRVFIDEGPLIDDLELLMMRCEPTLGKNGQLFLIGRANKQKPAHYFHRLYTSVKSGNDKNWKSIFVGWREHPGWDQERYEATKKHIWETTGSLDSLFEHHPETDVEALSPRELNKRIPPQWIAALYSPRPQIFPSNSPAIAGLKIFEAPIPGRIYCIGSDPAEGLPLSDDSVSQVIDAITHRQVAVLAGKISPETLGNQTADIAIYYNNAACLPEKNNHGILLIKALRDRGITLRNDILNRKPGWLTTEQSKATLYVGIHEVFMNKVKEAADNGESPDPVLCDYATSIQLGSIELDTLSAPESFHDDYAMALVLAYRCAKQSISGLTQMPYEGLFDGKDAPRAVPNLPKAKQAEIDWITELRYNKNHALKTRRS